LVLERVLRSGLKYFLLSVEKEVEKEWFDRLAKRSGSQGGEIRPTLKSAMLPGREKDDHAT